MATISNTLTNPEGDPIVGAGITVRLVSTLGNTAYHTPDGHTVTGPWYGTTNDDGEWEIDLIPNEQLVPSGSSYVAEERLPDSRADIVRTAFIVPDDDSDHWLYEIMVVAPPGGDPTPWLSDREPKDLGLLVGTPGVGLKASRDDHVHPVEGLATQTELDDEIAAREAGDTAGLAAVDAEATTRAAADTAHANAGDPHAGYLQKAGGTMTGLLTTAAAGIKLGNGTTLLSGAGAPATALGANGDAYYRTDGNPGSTFYIKRAGAWHAVDRDKAGRIDALTAPYVIGHRGMANVLPENTLLSYRGVVETGHPILEGGDWRMLKDGTLGAMHDLDVARTTDGVGNVADFTTASFKDLNVDAGSWFGGGFPTNLRDGPPLWREVLREFGGRVAMFPEAKSTGATGAILRMVNDVVAMGLQDCVVITSFSQSDLAVAAAAGIQCALAADNLTSGQMATAKAAGIDWLLFSTAVASPSTYIANALAAGLKPIVYTINRQSELATWLALGAVGCYSDDPLYINGSNNGYQYRVTTDPWKAGGHYYHGHIAGGARGSFLGTAGAYRWGFTNVLNETVLMGWACPVANAASSWTLGGTITYDTVGADNSRWAGIFICAPTDVIYNDAGASTENGYLILFRANGQMSVFRRTAGVGTTLSPTGSSTARVSGDTLPFTIAVTPTQITVTRTDTGVSFTVADSTHRGGYISLLHNCNGNAMAVSFSNLTIS